MMRIFSYQVIKWLAPLGLAFFASACTELPEARYASGQVRDLQFNVMYLPANDNQTEARVGERVRGLVDHIELQFSSTLDDSEVSRVNRWRSTQPMVLTRELEEFLQKGIQLYQLTDGALSVFAGEDLEAGTVPIHIQNHQLYKSQPDLEMNYDLMIKGFMIDRVAALLELMNIGEYHIEINGHTRQSQRQRSGLRNGQRYAAVGTANFSAVNAEIKVIHESAVVASTLSQWLATQSIEQALAYANAWELSVAIEQDENGAIKRYTSTAYRAEVS